MCLTDHIIKSAKEAGWTDLQLEMASPAERNRLARLYAIARNEALDEAQALVQTNALACDPGSMLQTYLASNAAAIHALKDTK